MKKSQKAVLASAALAPLLVSVIGTGVEAAMYNPPASNVTATQICITKIDPATGNPTPANKCLYFNVKLTWSAPKGYSGISGYQIFFEKKGQSLAPIQVGKVLTYTVTHVAIGTYVANISARGTKGTSMPPMTSMGTATITVHPWM